VAGVEDRIRSRKYSGLLAQLLIDKAICEKSAGNPGAIDGIMAEALKTAADSHYEVIGLRVLGIDSGLKKEAHNCQDAWIKSTQGLKIYWQASYPVERLFQLYQPLSECGEFQGLWHTAYVIRTRVIDMREAIDRSNHRQSPQLATLYLDLANIEVALKREESARKAAARAMDIINPQKESPTERKYRIGIIIRLAELQVENGKPDAALTTLQKDIEVLDTIDDAVLKMRGYTVLGDIHRLQGKLDVSEHYYQKGIVRSEASLLSLPGSRERLEWLSVVDRLYRGLDQVWLKQARAEDAWKLWEWYKGRSIQASHSKKIEAAEIAWPLLEKKIRQLVVPEEPNPRLSYAVFNTGTQLWLVQNARITSQWIPIEKANIEQKTVALFDRASRPTSTLKDVWQAGADLYPVVWQPVSGETRGSRTITVELDSPIQHLLLEAVRANGRYLSETYNFVYSPGVVMDLGLRPAQEISSKSPAFLLDASRSSGESPIPSQLHEVRTISHELEHINVKDGGSVTLEEINAALKSNSLFIFAGHGIREARNLTLLLRPNLTVGASDLQHESLGRLQLAVLAACSTGTTDENGLMDPRSLDNSFLAAGVPRIISSRWDVDSDSTTELIEGLVAKLAQRVPVAQAMYSVQQSILQREQHPYYWAGFYLAGKAN
jgi:CHAT domain-containing protein